MNIECELRTIIEDILMSPVDLTPATVASEVEGWDSIAHISIIIAIEKKYNFRFNHDELSAIENFGDLCSVVRKNVENNN